MVFTRLLEATENMRNLLFYKFPEALTKASDLLLSFNETVQDAKQKNDQAFAIIHHLARLVSLASMKKTMVSTVEKTKHWCQPRGRLLKVGPKVAKKWLKNWLK